MSEVAFSGKEEHSLRRRAELQRVFGGEIGALLAEPSTTELMINPDGALFIDRLYQGMSDTGMRFHPIDVQNTIITAAGELGQIVDAEHPWLQCELTLDGSRLQAWIPPAVVAPTLVIRKHRKQGVDGVPALSVADYVSSGTMAPNYERILKAAVLDRLNVLIVGGTSSGKTTLGGAYLNLISELCPNDRIITIEDTFELYCMSKNRVALRETPHLSMRMLLQQCLRARPDRIIFGEVRQEAAYDLVTAWNTGHNGGFCTIHANNVTDAFDRLEILVEQAGYPLAPRRIAKAVQLVIGMERNSAGKRHVHALAYVHGWNKDGYILEEIQPEATPSTPPIPPSLTSLEKTL